MPVDPQYLEHLLAMPDLDTREVLEIDGVPVPLPVKGGRGKRRHLDWQRRVSDDLVPDSVNSDAPERMPFAIVDRLTTGQRTARSIEDVFQGDLAPLEPIFRADALRKTMTLAVHVLAVKGAAGDERTRGFSERTFLVLCRDAEGRLDEPLVRDVIERFRADPQTLDLAQRTILERLEPDWTPNQEPRFELPAQGHQIIPPFDPTASELFRRDLRTLLAVDLGPADFFQNLNLLLAVHTGLYQPRLAAMLNPQMDVLYDAIANPTAAQLGRMERLEAAARDRHPFTASLDCRAPDGGVHRPVTLQTPARQSWQRLSRDLARFHFSLIMIIRLRQLAEAYRAHEWGVSRAWLDGTLDEETADGLRAATRTPQRLVEMVVGDEEFRSFLQKATTALAVRFVHHQIAESGEAEGLGVLRRADSGAAALRDLYQLASNQSARSASNSRAYRQGIQVSSSLLNQGQFGIVQPRARVGPFFELGAGILPLFLLLIVGPNRPKVNVRQFWEGLAEYGLRFAPEERERLLSRLKAMGVYERFSDAGEAAYVRNLMVRGAA